MRILMDGRPLLRPWHGGVPRLASRLLPAIRHALPHDEIVVAATGFDPMTSQIDIHKPLPNKLVAFLTFTGFFSFDRLVGRGGFDAMFLPNIEFVGRPALPYALLVHDLSFLIEPKWFNRKMRIWHKVVHAKRLIREAAHLFAVSETTKRDLMRLLEIDPARVTVIPMGLDPLPALPDNDRVSGAHDHAPLPHNGRFILCLGGSNPRKNASCIVTAHTELVKQEKYSDVKLILIGGTPPSRLPPPDSHLLPRPSDTELFTLMRDASIFCYSSWYEGFGMPLHEAARFGTPCIASTASSLPEIAPQGTTFASPAKPHHWVEAMCQSLDNPEKYRTKTVLGGWNEAGRIIAERLREIARV